MTPHQHKIAAIVSKLLAWFSSSARDLPWRQTRDPYGIWVSEIMLQQTRVETVLPYWEDWMQALPSLRDLAEAEPQRLHKLWEGLGYYTRVRNLQKAARQILQIHGGVFPSGFEEVLALPGVGRYTAGAICSIAFDQPTPILDGNVIRVLARLFSVRGNPRQGKSNERLWELAEELVLNASARRSNSSRSCSHLNQSLMELGALVCTPRNPTCDACPVRTSCAALRQDLVTDLPELPKRPAASVRRFVVMVVRKGNRFLVRQRPDGAVNGQLWEFPAVEVRGVKATLDRTVEKFFKRAPRRLDPLCRINHSITRYRITTEAFLVQGGEPLTNLGRWLSIEELGALPFSSAHKKILQHLAAS